MDVADVDIRRVIPFQNNKRYLEQRAPESLGKLYAMHWPYDQPETGRGVRTSPLHERLAARGANAKVSRIVVQLGFAITP